MLPAAAIFIEDSPAVARIEQMKDLAYWDRLSIKDVYAEAIDDRVKKYEKRNGTLKSRP